MLEVDEESRFGAGVDRVDEGRAALQFVGVISQYLIDDGIEQRVAGRHEDRLVGAVDVDFRPVERDAVIAVVHEARCCVALGTNRGGDAGDFPAASFTP